MLCLCRSSLRRFHPAPLCGKCLDSVKANAFSTNFNAVPFRLWFHLYFFFRIVGFPLYPDIRAAGPGLSPWGKKGRRVEWLLARIYPLGLQCISSEGILVRLERLTDDVEKTGVEGRTPSSLTPCQKRNLV